MRKMSRLDAACVALGVAVMDEWDKLPEGQEIRIRKVRGQPASETLVGYCIREIMHLESGELAEAEI